VKEGLTSRAPAPAGYLFRNAQFRLEIERSIDEAESKLLPAMPEAAGIPDTPYAGWEGFTDNSQTTYVQERLRWSTLSMPIFWM
jgi:hypothetical protein